MNNRWRRVAELKNWDEFIPINTGSINAVYRHDKASDDYKCVTWADDFKLRSKGFRKGAKHYATKRKEQMKCK